MSVLLEAAPQAALAVLILSVSLGVLVHLFIWAVDDESAPRRIIGRVVLAAIVFVGLIAVAATLHPLLQQPATTWRIPVDASASCSPCSHVDDEP